VTCVVGARFFWRDGFTSGSLTEYVSKAADKSLQDLWIKGLCEVFGVDSQDELIDQPCFVLRDFDLYNERIIGLECKASGLRFLARDFIRCHFPDRCMPSVLEDRKAKIHCDLAEYKHHVERTQHSLETIESKFYDWTCK
jgi:hypothetical protein